MSSVENIHTRENKIRLEDQSWNHFLDQFMDNLRQIVDYEAGSLFLFDDDSERLTEVASRGDGIDFISAVNFSYGSGLSAWVAQKGKLIYLPDIHRGSRHGLNPVRSYLSMPLEINNKVIGVLNLGHTIPFAFDDENMNRIQGLTKEITRKIYNKAYLTYYADAENNSAH